MDISGLTIAAATYRESGSYLGRNFSYQTYFSQALNGDLSSFSIYGTTTGERGYYYAAPVEVGERIIGVLAVKFNIAAFESIWRGADFNTETAAAFLQYRSAFFRPPYTVSPTTGQSRAAQWTLI